MNLLDLNDPRCNTITVHTYGGQSISVCAAGHPDLPVTVGAQLTMADWKLHRKDAETLTLFRPQNPDAAAVTLQFSPAVSIVAEAWCKGRAPKMLGHSALVPGISRMQCGYTALSADGAAQPEPAGPDPRMDELTRETEALREALAAQGRIAASGLAGAERLRDQLNAELAAVQQRLDALQAQKELLNVNLERARAHVRELETELQVVGDAVQVGSNPGYQSVPFVKLLKRAETAITNLQNGFALLVQGKELLLDKRGRAVVTTGVVSSDEDRIPDLPEDDPAQDDDGTGYGRYADIYESDTGSN